MSMQLPHIVRTLPLVGALTGIAGSAQAATRIPTHVACVGDSITQGSGASSGNTNYPADLQALFASSVQVKNFGHSGATMLSVGDVPYQQQSEYTSATTFVSGAGSGTTVDVVIMLGTNDSKGYNWTAGTGTRAEQFRTDCAAMVDHFAQLPTHPLVYLALPPTAYNNSYQISGTVIHDQIVPVLKQVAASKGIPTIDVNTPTAGQSELFPDGVHPNDNGYKLLAQVIHDGLLASDSAGDAAVADGPTPAGGSPGAGSGGAGGATTGTRDAASGDRGGAPGGSGAAGTPAGGSGTSGGSSGGAVNSATGGTVGAGGSGGGGGARGSGGQSGGASAAGRGGSGSSTGGAGGTSEVGGNGSGGGARGSGGQSGGTPAASGGASGSATRSGGGIQAGAGVPSASGGVGASSGGAAGTTGGSDANTTKPTASSGCSCAMGRSAAHDSFACCVLSWLLLGYFASIARHGRKRMRP